jgi:hypothetical protein
MLSNGHPQELGYVTAVSVRHARDAEPVYVDVAQLVAGIGIDGDMHVDPLSLRQLLIADEGAYQDLRLPAHALRENLLVTFDTSKLRSGSILRVGSDAMLWLTFQCEACGHLNTHNAGLSRVIGNRRGMLARVIRGGVIRNGDSIVDLGTLMAPWSDDWRVRVHKVLDAIPMNLVVDYKQLARLSGVPSSYCRVFPRVVRDLGAEYVKKAVPKQGKPGKARWDGAELFELACPAQSNYSKGPSTSVLINEKAKSMDSVRSDQIKEQLLNSLRQGSQGGAQTLEIGRAKVILTQNRVFRTDDAPETEAVLYPAAECAVADDYDSWLR